MSMILKRPETSCDCTVCQSMCKTDPCYGTPEDIEKIIDAGHKDKLGDVLWMDIKDGEGFFLIAPLQNPDNSCVFLKDGYCELHSQGLKPTEGRLAIHDKNDDGLRRTVCETWESQKGLDLVTLYDNTGGEKPTLIQLLYELKKKI